MYLDRTATMHEMLQQHIFKWDGKAIGLSKLIAVFRAIAIIVKNHRNQKKK